jgi:hypothetical protein
LKKLFSRVNFQMLFVPRLHLFSSRIVRDLPDINVDNSAF